MVQYEQISDTRSQDNPENHQTPDREAGAALPLNLYIPTDEKSSKVLEIANSVVNLSLLIDTFKHFHSMMIEIVDEEKKPNTVRRIVPVVLVSCSLFFQVVAVSFLAYVWCSEMTMKHLRDNDDQVNEQTRKRRRRRNICIILTIHLIAFVVTIFTAVVPLEHQP